MTLWMGLLVEAYCPNESRAPSVLRLAFDRVGLAALSVRAADGWDDD
jgi:hypothetical protein